jgi:SAM-dependent methyltransferase
MIKTQSGRERLALSLFAVFLVLGLALVFAAAEAVVEQKQPELTIRNSTTVGISYEIATAVPGAIRIKKTLPAGEIHRFPGDDNRDIFFQSGGTGKTYRLTAHRPYAFRYSETRSLDIYEASHGRTDVVDLAPFVPTPMPVVDMMLELAKIKETDVVFDLGCGDGRIVIAAAKKFGARGVGIELDPSLVRTARASAKAEGVERLVEFRLEDATKADIRRATVVALYLLPESNEILRDRLEQQLRPGSVVVSHNYRIPGWENKEVRTTTVKMDDGQEHQIFLYHR